MEKNFSSGKKIKNNQYLSIINEESHSFNNYTNIINRVNNRHTITKRSLDKKSIKRRVMSSLLKVMDRSTNICLNNINSINFIYQIYGKGINMIDHKDTIMNKTQSIMSCLEKHKFFTPMSTNKYNNYNNKNLLYSSENSKVNNYNIKDKILLNNKLNTKFKIKFKEYKKPLKRSNSCSIKDSKKANKTNFALLPLKNILLKKTIENSHYQPVMKHDIRTSIIYKKKNVLEEEKKREYLENLKIFSKKYEKEKEDFNNLLFDECIEFRKKKFILESFIKKFTNKHFVEKLYKVKEYALQKGQ